MSVRTAAARARSLPSLTSTRHAPPHAQVNVKFTFEAGKSSKPSVVYQIGGVDSSNPNNTMWWVRPWLGLFYLPMKLPYIVLDIDAENYTYLTASSPSTTGMGSWLYIMTRQKVVSDEFLAPLRKVASEAGWDLSKSERVPQSEAAVPQVPGMPEQETAIKS